MNDSDLCVNCLLLFCDDSAPDCAVRERRLTRHREYYKRNRVAMDASARAYRDRHREQYRAYYRAAYYRRKDKLK